MLDEWQGKLRIEQQQSTCMYCQLMSWCLGMQLKSHVPFGIHMAYFESHKLKLLVFQAVCELQRNKATLVLE